jgi:uncharacterized RDD family membrane protein YckC
LDLLIRGAIVVVLIVIGNIGGALGADGLAGIGSGVILLVLFLLEWGYYVVAETLMGGQSPGKRAFGLRVVKRGGQPLGFADSVLRNLLRGADVLPLFYALGVVTATVDPLFRRLGDLVADTVVVSEHGRRAIESVLQVNVTPTSKELAAIPHGVALAPDELAALEAFLRRRAMLAPAREVELAEMVAPLFARRFGIRYRDPSRLLAVVWARANRKC